MKHCLIVALLLLAGLSAVQARAAWKDTTIVEEGSPLAKEQAPAADSYAVQAGRFHNEAEARELAAQLREKGFKPHVLRTAEAGGQTWYAVRLSMHETLEEARATAREFSQEQGLHAMVAISGSTDPLPEAKNLFFLQTGAFQDRGNAVARVKHYRELGYDAGLLQLYDTSGKAWNIVYAGAYDSFQDAKDAADAFSEKAGEQCYINAIAPELFRQRSEAVE